MMNLHIHGYRLVLGSFACPEAYDVFDSHYNQVAYLRLRHGVFTVHCPDYGNDVVYSVPTTGDGSFTKHERMHHLNKAIEAIQEWIIVQNMKVCHEE